MRTVGDLLQSVSLAVLLLCGGAYCYGYLYRPPAFRPLHVAGLCFTGLALLQMFLFLYTPGGGRLNADYAMAFLVLAGFSQAVVAIRGRARKSAPSNRREADA